MTGTIGELEHRLRHRTAPLFCSPHVAGGPSPDEKTPKGFVGTEETEQLRGKLKVLLKEEGAIANTLDRRTAERMLKLDRRLTVAEAQLVSEVWGNYKSWLGRNIQRTRKGQVRPMH